MRRPSSALCAARMEFRSSLVDCSAGARPKPIPARSETMAQYPSTTAFGVKLRLIGGPGIHATHSRGSAITTPSAAMPATAESRKLSVRSCRTSRPRLAPSASRTPISRRRTDARARKRFERFAHQQRHPRFGHGDIRAAKVARRDAKDRDRLAIQRNRAPDHAPVTAELALPEVVAQHCERAGAGRCAFRSAPGATELCRRAEHGKIISRRENSVELARLRAADGEL